MLPEAAVSVLRQFKQRLTASPREVVWSLPKADADRVAEAQDTLEARQHARWAAEHLVEVLKRNNLDAERELIEAKAWALKVLLRRYLVNRDLLNDSYARAIELAESR